MAERMKPKKSPTNKASKVSMSKDTLKRLAAIRREAELASGVKLVTKTIPSDRDKAKCPKRQRKQRKWQEDI